MYSDTHNLSDIINHLPNRVFWKDLNSNYLGCNKAFAEVLDLKNPADIVNKSTESLCVSNAMAKVYRQHDEQVLLKNSEISVSEFVYDMSRKAWTMSVGEIMPFYNKDGSRAGVLGSVRPIFQLKNKHAVFNYNNNEVRLSLRELQIWHYICDGANSREIAGILQRSPKTIESYVSNMTAKFGCGPQRKLLHVAQTLRFHRISIGSMMIGFNELLK